jgi:acetolactate synthase-1/2/3 large subunit
MKASELLVNALVNEGVNYVFGIPGEENLDFLDALSRSPIKLVLTRHEQAAGFMAATYGRLTGKAGVCLSTLGPGATNLVTAAAYANLGAMPMVMLTGQKPIKTSKQGQFQIVDVIDMMQPLTKFSRRIDSGDRIPSCVREAFRRAQEERPGASHLELPEDIARETTQVPVIDPSYTRRPVAEERVIERAVALIANANHPLLLIGAGANRKRPCRMLREFIDRTGIPFVTTQMGKGVINEDSESFLGNAALSSGDFVHRALDAADVIINVGHDVVEKPPFLMQPGGRTVISCQFHLR